MSQYSALRYWAERLLDRSGASKNVQLRVDDLLAAFAVGLNTDDGKSLVQFYRGESSDAGAVSAVCAIARQSECDDIELTSCVTPGAVVIPIALAYGRKSEPGRRAAAICRGYEAGIIFGRALRGAEALPKVWPTLLAAPLMAAVTYSFLNGYDGERLVHAMALSLAGASGRVGRVSGTPSGRWIAFAQSIQKGIRAAEAAGQGFKGDPHLCEGDWCEMQAGHSNIDRTVFVEPLWPGMDQTDFKLFPIARQAATAVGAFQNFMAKGLDPNTIEAIEVTVPRMNAAMLSRPAILGDRTSLLCNLGFQVACAAFAPDLLYDPERRAASVDLVEFSRRVMITPSDDFAMEIASGEWPARVVVHAAGTAHVEYARTGAEIGGCTAKLHDKWRRIMHGEDRRDFFENVVNAPPGSHAMLWDWVKQRLAKAAQSGAEHENH
jgi:2-methylcitrate dehydratase PrpD